jgi:beta-glucosidase
VERIAHVTAEETRATGPQWVFAPCVCVARDLRWGRTYESYSEDPGLVIKMETAIDGLQGPHACELDEPDRTLAMAKHYAGDGDGEYGTGSGDYPIDQGITVTSRRGTRSPTGGTWARSARRRTGPWPGGPSAPRRSC